MLLLTNGEVLAQQEDAQQYGTEHWWKLTPDAFGDYSNGSWTQVADNGPPPMKGPFGPLYYCSAVLRDGRAFVSGGEYNHHVSGADLLWAAVYDPLTNTWTELPTPKDAANNDWQGVGDAPGCMLPSGEVLVGNIFQNLTAIYDPVANVWIPRANKLNTSSSEETFTLLADGTALTVNCDGNRQSQKYLPSTNQWVTAGQTPDDLVETASKEIGPAILLPDKRLFAIGATGRTALYTADPNPALPGTWARGPSFPPVNPNQTLGAKDAPAALEPNGKVLCLAGPVDGIAGNYNPPTYFFEFDPTAGTLTKIADPGNSLEAPYSGRMMLLPTGEILFVNGTSDVWIYSPDGAPQPAWRPQITNCASVLEPGKTYVLQGRQLNGLSQAVSYGDDAQMATNYPLVRVRNLASGHVFYCRTANHSTMGVATGAAIHSTEFTTPAGIESGSSELVVVANGIASEPFPVSVGCPDEGGCMGVSKLDIWVSDVADACGTWPGSGLITILDCKGILSWPCGRFLANGTWQKIPNGQYRNIPFTCGHLTVELPPGCYWVVAGFVTPLGGRIHLNGTTHVGVVEVCCEECACVKLFNPTVRLCWDWFRVGIRMLSQFGTFDAEKVERIEDLANDLLQDVQATGAEKAIAEVFGGLLDMAGRKQ